MNKKRKFLVMIAIIGFLMAACDNGSTDTQVRSDFTYTGTTSLTITGYTGSSDSVNIPNQIDGKPVTAIGNGAFFNKGLSSVSIPDSITLIGSGAFSRNLLTGVVIPNSVTLIGDSAFWNNDISSIVIGNGVISIDVSAFSNNRLSTVAIGNSVSSIGYGAFHGNPALSAINVSTGNANYSSLDGVLYNKAGTTLIQWPIGKPGRIATIPNNVTSIESRAFYNHNLNTITIGANVSLGTDAFYDSYSSSDRRNSFQATYNNNGRLAGTYTASTITSTINWSTTTTTTWTRQE